MSSTSLNLSMELLNYGGGKYLISSVVQKSKKESIYALSDRIKLQERFVHFKEWLESTMQVTVTRVYSDQGKGYKALGAFLYFKSACLRIRLSQVE